MTEDKRLDEFEQVKSKPTKPDLSRNKSLYFLLLAVGRQMALRKPEHRLLYREAFKTLSIDRTEESWDIKIHIKGDEFQEKIHRSEFHFYSTGLDTSTDETSERNFKRAELFWLLFESNITPTNSVRSSRFKRSKNVLCNKFSATGTQLLQIVMILLMFSPNDIKNLLFTGVAIAPLYRLFWHSKSKRKYVLLFSALLIVIVLKFPLSNQSPSSNPPIIFISLLLSLIWSHYYNLNSLTVSGLGRKALFILVTLIMLTISVYFEVSVEYVISFICLVITSLCIQGFRKKLIISSAGTMLTVLIEILIGLFLGFSLISNVNLSLTLNLDFNFVIPIIGFVLWTLNLFIFERHAMALRVFYPFVFLSNIFTEDTPNSLFIPALLIMVLSVATLTKPPRNREIRYA